jgi:hypothetical protein
MAINIVLIEGTFHTEQSRKLSRQNTAPTVETKK